MKTFQVLFLVVCTVFMSSCEITNRIRTNPKPVVHGRTQENFGHGWLFQRQEDTLEGADRWEEISIPHSVKIEPLVVNDQWQGRAFYKKTFDVVTLNDQKWFFLFEGVMQEARVSINGTPVLTHKGGYLPFTVDATPHLLEGTTNEIEVEVINTDDPTIPPGKNLDALDFNMYGGIYRNVHLIRTNKIHITDPVYADEVNSGGILVHFNSVSEDEAEGFVKVHIQNDSEVTKELEVRATFTDVQGFQRVFSSSAQQVAPGEDASFTQDVVIINPLLWSTALPQLYTLRVEVLSGEEIIDTKEIRTGIRDIRLTGKAFYLNGKEMFINGTNRHQEYPYVGYALSDEAQYRDAYKIKQAGFDFVRLSHYPQATAFLEACDELGLLVMNAIPGWQFFEEGEFAENAIQDIKDMVRRDRNHPSVVFWENSLNESGMTEEFMIRANEVLRAELPYDDTYSAGWIDHPSYDLFIPARQHGQPPYYWNLYNKPNRPVFIAEYGDWEYYAQNAGFDQATFSDLREEERTSRQLRGAGEVRLLQQALNFQEAFNSNLKGEQTIGHANWLMFDYNRGYADDLEASGIAGIFRIPKFSYYFYKSQKSPYADYISEPMVFIANFWTPQSTPQVKVFSNTEEVALYLNGNLVDRKRPDINRISDELPHPPFVFDLTNYESGELMAVGYIDSEEVATHTVRSPGKPAKIRLAWDISGKGIARTTPDVVFVYAIITDKNGTVVPTSELEVEFSLEGDPENAALIGQKRVKAEAGIAPIILRTEYLRRAVTVKATAGGLGEDIINIENH